MDWLSAVQQLLHLEARGANLVAASNAAERPERGRLKRRSFGAVGKFVERKVRDGAGATARGECCRGPGVQPNVYPTHLAADRCRSRLTMRTRPVEGIPGQSSAGPGIPDITHLTIECSMKASMLVNRSGGMSVEP